MIEHKYISNDEIAKNSCSATDKDFGRMFFGKSSDNQLDEYSEFLKKFEAKKTTDDCYTPKEVYQVILDYVDEKIIPLHDKEIARPFYPNGDYKKHSENYNENTIVIDNPPFSILAEIKQFYKENNIKFFLFCPYLTAFSRGDKDFCTIITDYSIRYENGAKVNTSFVTNLIDDLVIKGDHELYERIKDAQEKTQATKKLPKYKYPSNVVLSTTIGYLTSKGVSIEIKKEDAFFIRRLDDQVKHKKALFGAGFLVTDEVAKELQAKEQKVKEDVIYWKLSDRERRIIEKQEPLQKQMF